MVFSKNLLKEENQESQEGKKKSQNSGEPEQNQRLGRYDNMLWRCLLKQLFVIFIKIQRLVANTSHRSTQAIAGQLCIFN